MRRLYAALPGPALVRALLATVIVVAVLAALVWVFEWAGDLLLDTGGTVGR